VLLDGVDDLSFGVGTMTRYRDGDPVSSTGDVWGRAVDDALALELPIVGGATFTEEEPPYYDPTGVPGVLRDGDHIALGFRVGSAAPDGMSTVDGVAEEVSVAGVSGLTLPVTFLTEIPAPPMTVAELTGVVEDVADGVLGLLTGGSDKVTICHIPPSNPQSSHTITISSSALDAHLAHGDSTDDCPPVPGTLTVTLYESRAPDDGRPFGDPIASLSFPAESLPAATSVFEGISEVADALVYGVAPVLSVEAPDVDVALDLSPLALSVTPGTPYTLVLDYEGSGAVFLRRGASDGATGVATRWVDETTFGAEDVAVALSLDGALAFTQTVRHEVVNRVTTTITLTDGRSISGSALVATQAAITEPWHGAAPGEFPELALSGR